MIVKKGSVDGRCYLHGGLRTAEGLERMRAAKTRHGCRLREMIRQLRAEAKVLIEVC